jgi:hypothetical protein
MANERRSTSSLVACQAMLVVGIVLREVAEAIDVGWGEEADAY